MPDSSSFFVGCSQNCLQELHCILSKRDSFLSESKRKSFLAAATQSQSDLILRRLLNGLEPLAYGGHECIMPHDKRKIVEEMIFLQNCSESKVDKLFKMSEQMIVVG